jgi:DNA-binding response OmpR family regulator
MAHILITDDEQKLVTLLQHVLDKDGHQIESASDGSQALTLLSNKTFDLAIVDIVMPELDGLQVCQRIRGMPATRDLPVLVLSARGTLQDRINGFEAGCDDYVVKPFSITELRWRVKALLRRRTTPNPADESVSQAMPDRDDDTIKLDPNTYKAHVKEQSVQLTPTEFKLLHYLTQNHERVFSSRQLLQRVWDYPADSGNTGLVRTHIKNLRAKIEPTPHQPTYIKTVPRHGYTVNLGTTD